MINIQQEIAELKQQLAELEAKMSDSTGLQWPQEGDYISMLCADIVVPRMKWTSCEWKKEALKRGLIVRTEEEAERADRKRMAIHKWNTLAGDQSWVDWRDEKQYKFYPCFDHPRREWIVRATGEFQVWPFAYHETKADCEAAIKEMGEMMSWLLY